MRFLCDTDASTFMGSDCEHKPLSGLPKSLQMYLRKLTELLADTFLQVTTHGENFSSALGEEFKREGLEMTPKWQRDNSQTGAAEQNFSGSETGIINMKGIWQELRRTDSTLAGFFPGFL